MEFNLLGSSIISGIIISGEVALSLSQYIINQYNRDDSYGDNRSDSHDNSHSDCDNHTDDDDRDETHGDRLTLFSKEE